MPKKPPTISAPSSRVNVDNARPENRSGYNSDRYNPRDLERSRRESERDDVMDGSYGFEDRMDTDDPNGRSARGRGSLYSDNLISDRGRRRGDSRDRGRGDRFVRGNGGRGYR